MGETHINCSAPTIRALLAGRKTQTRLVTKKQDWPAGILERFPRQKACVPCLPGDRLWAREAHILLPRTAYRGSIGTGTIEQREHPTDGYTAAVFREGFDRSGRKQWRSSTQMPRWASRFTLVVTDVRVERLQDISEEDARAEGAMLHVPCKSAVGGTCLPSDSWYFDQSLDGRLYEDSTARGAFEILWGKLNGWKSWDTNPWVAAISFEVRRANIDALSSTSEAAA